MGGGAEVGVIGRVPDSFPHRVQQCSPDRVTTVTVAPLPGLASSMSGWGWGEAGIHSPPVITPHGHSEATLHSD